MAAAMDRLMVGVMEAALVMVPHLGMVLYLVQ
jgi:hypothetical protein